MRFASFNKKGEIAVAIKIDDKYLDLSLFDTIPNNLINILKDFEKFKEYINNIINNNYYKSSQLIEQIDYLPPIINPSKVICVGLNYNEHIKETNYEKTIFPTLFARFNNSYVGYGKFIEGRNISKKLDYEGELAVVIGKEGKNITKDKANDYIAGYSIFNDYTLRDYQSKTSQWFAGKNTDNCGAFGPLLVTKDELPKFANGLTIKTFVNGELRQDSSTSKMIFKVDELIEIISSFITLNVGDVIITGTPEGAGFSMQPKKYLQNNDVCEVQIQDIGILRNTII